MRIKLSKSDWENIGKKMGWIKTAQQDPEHTYNMGDGHQYADFEETPDDESEDSDEGGEFDYLTDGHEDDARMMRLKAEAESLAEDHDDSGDVHVALYWLLSHYHGGQNSPEYAALSNSPYSPGPLERGPDESAEIIYEDLERAYKGS